MPKKPANPVTPPAREAFVLYLKHWQERLGLIDWRIVVSAKPAAKTDMAAIHGMDYEARLAPVRLGPDFGGLPVTDESIEALAVHELGHVMLKELIVLCRDPKVPDDVIYAAEHRVINAYTHALTGRN